MLRKQKTTVTMKLNNFLKNMTNFASLTVTVIQVNTIIHSASGSKVWQRQKKEWVNKIILNHVINFFRKVKVKKQLTISLLLKRIFLNLMMPKNFITSWRISFTNILGREKDVSWYCYCDYRCCCFIKKMPFMIFLF